MLGAGVLLASGGVVLASTGAAVVAVAAAGAAKRWVHRHERQSKERTAATVARVTGAARAGHRAWQEAGTHAR